MVLGLGHPGYPAGDCRGGGSAPGHASTVALPPSNSSTLPRALCSRRTYPIQIARPPGGNAAALVPWPPSALAARNLVPGAGGAPVILSCSLTSRRFTCPRERTRSTISCPV